MTDPQVAYLELVARVDDFTRRVVERYPGMLHCELGCDDCCQRDLSLFPIEVARLIEQVGDLPPDQKARVLSRAQTAQADEQAACPLLEEGGCLVYAVRPVICRSHGLPMLIPDEDSLSLCPHNFKGVMDLAGDCVMDLGPVNRILATTNLMRAQALGGSAERVAVSRALIEAFAEGGTA